MDKPTNGWSGPDKRPEDRLKSLLGRHKLPAGLRFESERGGCAFAGPEVDEPTWPMCYLKGCSEGRERTSNVHNLLIAAANVLSPSDEFQLGSVRASREDTARLAEYLGRVSDKAATHAHVERLADVHGLISFLDIHLRQPLNVLLTTMLAHAQASPFWRAVSDTDRTGWELVVHFPQGRYGRRPPLTALTPLAFVHVIWPCANPQLEQFTTDITGGAIRMLDTRRLGYVRSAAAGPEGEAVCRLGEQILHHMFARKVNYYIVTDYTNFVLFQHVPATGPSALERGTIRVIKHIQGTPYTSDSPLALLLAATIAAAKANGTSIMMSTRRASFDHIPWIGALPSPPVTHSPDSFFLSPPSPLHSPRPPLRPLRWSPLPLIHPPPPPTVPLDLGPVAITHAWESDGTNQYCDPTLAVTMYGPVHPDGALPRLAVRNGFEFYTLMRHINGNQGPSRRHESDSYSLESDMGRPFDAYLLMRPGCRRGEGRLWSANEAVLQLASGGECVVIEKACESYNFCDIDESDWQRTRPSWREAKGAVAHEARLYAGPLAALQGRAVPRFLGLFGRLHHDDEIWHMLLEDAGEPLHLEERANSVVQNQIRALYAALHRAGVRHGDVGWQHVLRCGMEVRLIDFDRATVRPDTTTDTEWDRLCEAERGYVHLMLRNPADMNTA